MVNVCGPAFAYCVDALVNDAYGELLYPPEATSVGGIVDTLNPPRVVPKTCPALRFPVTVTFPVTYALFPSVKLFAVTLPVV